MPVTVNLKTVVDLPVWQYLRPLPVTSAAGACLCNDKRGTDRYVYFLFSATDFWRYDVYTDTWQKLAIPPTFTFAAGCTMTYDPSRGYVWLFAPYSSSPYAVFAYYDTAAGAWTSRNAPSGLASQWGTDADLTHTCTTYNAGGNDDYLYLIGNNSTTWYRFSVSGNSWTTMATAITAAPGAGCGIYWVYGYDTDKLYIIRGGATSTIYVYSIGTPGFTTLSYIPSAETFTTGTCASYDGGTSIYIQKDATQRVYRLKLQASPVLEPSGTILYTAGTAHVGQGMMFAKSADGLLFLYYRQQSGTYFFRALIWW
jgi:hypothetical protein